MIDAYTRPGRRPRFQPAAAGPVKHLTESEYIVARKKMFPDEPPLPPVYGSPERLARYRRRMLYGG